MKNNTMYTLAQKSVCFYNWLLKRYGLRMEVAREGRLVTREMAYDAVDDNTSRIEFDKYEDYTRYRTLELVVEEIRKKYSPEELSCFCVAEAGVFKGDFAWIINEKFPECEMFLYDTFEGFEKKDILDEFNHSFTEEGKLKRLNGHFGNLAGSPEKRIEAVMSKLKYKDTCHLRKGYFPDSANDEKEKRWIFVSLDMDLYQPMKAGLFYFWPNIVDGGFIFVHDYNNKDFWGIKEAVSELEKEFGRIYRIPISDQGGTIILCK
ncbi:MAG: methyltransferase [Lachnospiraceae bacterium]|nr:methyltransferase [Lachnospiraceae bacterium]